MDGMNWGDWSNAASVYQAVVVTIVGLWAYFRFRKERTHYPHIEFSVDCIVHGTSGDEQYVAEFLVTIRNHGYVQQRFNEILLSVRIPDYKNKKLSTFEESQDGQGRGPSYDGRLFLPRKIIDDVDIIPPKYKPYIVEPDCEEVIRYITPISANIGFMLVHAEYFYPELVRPDLNNWYYIFKLAIFYIRKLINRLWPPGYPTRPRTTEKFIQVEPIKDKTSLSE